MEDQQIIRYLELSDRRTEIILTPAADWKPEYGPELEQIDCELEELEGVVGIFRS